MQNQIQKYTNRIIIIQNRTFYKLVNQKHGINQTKKNNYLNIQKTI